MPQSQVSQTSRMELAEAIVKTKAEKGLSFQDLTSDTNLSLAYVTAADNVRYFSHIPIEL
jgi:cyanate lyase